MSFLYHKLRSDGQYAEQGASLVEYALLVGLIALVAIGGLTSLGQSSSEALAAAENTMACPTLQRDWDNHQQDRLDHLANRTWTGSANQDTRDAWWEKRNTLVDDQNGRGCDWRVR